MSNTLERGVQVWESVSYTCLNSFNRNYRIPNLCFLEDVDLIFKVFKSLLDRHSEFVGPRLFHHFQNCRFPKF